MCAYIDRHPIRIIKIEVQLLTVATAKQQIFICVQLSLIYKDTWDNCNGWVFFVCFFLQAKNKIQSIYDTSCRIQRGNELLPSFLPCD